MVRRGCVWGALGLAIGIGGGCGLVLDTTPPATQDAGLPDAGRVPCDTDQQCSDGLFCTGVESCVDGFCQRGTRPACGDGISCTVDRCDEPSGMCVHDPDDTKCDADEQCRRATGCAPIQQCTDDSECQDESLCNGTEQCVDGRCEEGAPVACPDVGCLRRACDPDTGRCAATPDHDACADVIPCTGDICGSDGECVHDPIEGFCADEYGCTVDACRPNEDLADERGCIHYPNDAACPDALGPCHRFVCAPDVAVDEASGCGVATADLTNACDPRSTCDVRTGVCSALVQVECEEDAQCDDGDPCNGRERCVEFGAEQRCVAALAQSCPAEGDCFDAVCDIRGDENVCAPRRTSECFDGPVPPPGGG